MTLNPGLKATIFWAVLIACTARVSDQAIGQSTIREEINTLKGEVQALRLRIAQRVIVCGKVDSERMKGGTTAFRLGCDPTLDAPGPVRERLTVVLDRPGVFKFKFMMPRRGRPIVIATPSDRWGSIPIAASSLRVSEVTETGFTVQTFDTVATSNPTNVDFFFAVLGESPWLAN